MLEILLAGFLTAVLSFATKALLRGAHDPRMSRSNRRVLTGSAAVAAIFSVFAGLQFGQLLADTLLPFDRIETDVIGYRSGSGGRLPSHARIETTSGSYDLPFLLLRPAGLSSGRYVLVVTHFERLVVEVVPRRD